MSPAFQRLGRIAILRLALLNLYAFPLRLIRPNVGLTTLSFNRVTNALFKGVRGPLDARLPCGTSVEIDPDEYHGRITWMVGSADWKVSRTVRTLISPGDVLLDIGANYGSIGLEAAPKIGPEGRVHMFEPQARVADRLAAAIDRGGFDNVELHRIALSDEDGEIVLAGPAHHTGMATILKSDELDRSRAHSETVQMHDTARFVAPLVDGRRFGVKIDIEGAEPMVLPGLIEQPGLRFVVFEGVNSQCWLWDFFTGAGLTIFGMDRSILRSQVRLLEHFEDWSGFHDFVAVKMTGSVPSKTMGLGEFRRFLDQSGW